VQIPDELSNQKTYGQVAAKSMHHRTLVLSFYYIKKSYCLFLSVVFGGLKKESRSFEGISQLCPFL